MASFSIITDPTGAALGLWHASTLKGSFLFHARRYPEAVEQTRTTLESHPTFWIALLQRARRYEHEGRYEEAIATFRKAQEHGSTPSSLSPIGFTYAASGRREEAELKEVIEVKKR